MDRALDNYQSYSWHQSHDQATILLLLPYETVEEDVAVIIGNNFLVAGVRGQPPVVKGRLYGSVEVSGSMWQLEPTTSRFSARERTTSTTSTTSTQSSFALVSDTDFSTSFAASLEGGLTSDMDESYFSSPALSSPVSLSEDYNGFPLHSAPQRQPRLTTSHPVSPGAANPSLSLASSFSSVESFHAGSGRLLTLHLEKAESVIWPSLIVGPAPDAVSPTNLCIFPWVSSISASIESRYNMDPTSLVLIGLELCDIRNDKEEAFEYFVRAWHKSHVPSATIRLATHYLPVTAAPSGMLSSADMDTPATPTSDSPSISPSSTPTAGHATPPYTHHMTTPVPGSLAYYVYSIGGAQSLAQLYLEAGLLYLEGTASSLLSSSYAGLSSLRTPTLSNSLQPHSRSLERSAITGIGSSGSDAWNRDRELARKYFDRARDLQPGLDVPLLPPPSDSTSNSIAVSPVLDEQEQQLKIPTIELPNMEELTEKQVRRRRQRGEDSLRGDTSASSAVEEKLNADGEDHTWYLYLPGLVGAGTALLVVGFLSFSSWRKGQNS